MILYAEEIVHPEILTPSGPSKSSLEKTASDSEEELDDDQSYADDTASLRVLWDQGERNNRQRPESIASLASSFRSHFTKKTGYVLGLGYLVMFFL